MFFIVTISETGSFRKAAEKLFVSQSTISTRIKKLETELGTEIFDRNGSSASLTPAGRKLLLLSQSIIQQKNEIRKLCAAQPSERLRLIIYAQHLPLAARTFAEYISLFSQTEYELGFIETNTREILSAVINYRADAGLIVLCRNNQSMVQDIAVRENLCIRTVYSGKPQVYLSADHPLAHKDMLKHSELQECPHLYFDQNAQFLPFHIDNGPIANPEIPKNIFVNDRLSAFIMLRLNQAYCIGIGKLTNFESIFSSLNNTVKAVPLDSETTMSVAAIFRKDHLTSRVIQDYLDLLKQQLLD